MDGHRPLLRAVLVDVGPIEAFGPSLWNIGFYRHFAIDCAERVLQTEDDMLANGTASRGLIDAALDDVEARKKTFDRWTPTNTTPTSARWQSALWPVDGLPVSRFRHLRPDVPARANVVVTESKSVLPAEWNRGHPPQDRAVPPR
jgi:hypothetical protein